MDRHERDFDLIVFGASGYTGRLVADAVQALRTSDVRWAIAGRDASRLAPIAARLGDVPIVTADAGDPASLEAMTRRTHAIVTTVGPYARYGTPLVAASVASGTHYADLTGESTWIRSIIDRFDGPARQANTRIVPACGFDSVPSDLGVAELQRIGVSYWGRPFASIVHALGPVSGGVSGGTIASAMDLADAMAHDGELRRALLDPELLAPGGASSDDPLGPLRPLRHAGLEGWSAPFVMAPANAKVVRRTRFLLGEPWGDEVGYLERALVPTWARAATLILATGLGAAILAARPLRRLAERVLPGPGSGPSRAARERGFFVSTFVGYDHGGRAKTRLRLSFDRDPGYGATSRMLAAMGLHLAGGGDAAEATGPARGGVLTPAVAGGSAYLERLTAAGLDMSVEHLDAPHGDASSRDSTTIA